MLPHAPAMWYGFGRSQDLPLSATGIDGLFPAWLRAAVSLGPIPVGFMSLLAMDVARKALYNVSKLSIVSPLLPWLHPDVVAWEGPWYLRVTCEPAISLLADGIKPIEVMPVGEWITYAPMGFIVTALFMSGTKFSDLDEFIAGGRPPGAISRDGLRGKV